MLKPINCELTTRPIPVSEPKGKAKTKSWIASTFVAYAYQSRITRELDAYQSEPYYSQETSKEGLTGEHPAAAAMPMSICSFMLNLPGFKVNFHENCLRR